MPELNGIDATRALIRSGPHVNVLILTMFDNKGSPIGSQIRWNTPRRSLTVTGTASQWRLSRRPDGSFRSAPRSFGSPFGSP